ncbi:MAG: polyprenyl synthetase family protein [Lachnospiraceae bacterium]|nr:polyprenyl synthetase family protein [Lachnospiraceae bacterium]MDE7020177.1 polyprenyl synthetase family protein [Lachnospiraceae bacterium]
MNFKETLNEKTVRIEEILAKFLPEEQGYQKTVIEAMNYSILAGGKRLRPMLMEETWEMFGGTGELVEPFMAAIEMIHNYSLVHDDLPAMDNDEYRRGRKTTHVVYGEGMAVLAGDALLNYAFETACTAFEKARNPEEYRRVAKAMTILSRKAGIYGMIGGQCADIEAEERQESVTEELLLFIHEHKTAALIQSAMMIGGILAGADTEQTAAIEKCAWNIGIAFQIQDDILDVTGSQEILGKPIGSDEKNNKVTYVTIHGLEKSSEMVASLSEEAVQILSSFSGRNPFLEKLVQQLISREK